MNSLLMEKMKNDIESLKRQMEDNFRKAGGRPGDLKFDERMFSRSTWRTSGQKLIITSEHDQMGRSQLEYTYHILNDTLKLTNFKGGVEIMVRDRVKVKK